LRLFAAIFLARHSTLDARPVWYCHKKAQNSQKTALDSGRWSLDGLYFSDYQLLDTSHCLVTPESRSAQVDCVFLRFFAANSSSTLDSGRSTCLVSPQKGSKFIKSYLCLMTSRGHSLAGNDQQTNLPPGQSGSLRDQSIIQFLNERFANFTFH